MGELGSVVAGYVLTVAAILGYLVRIRRRIARLRRTPRAGPGSAR